MPEKAHVSSIDAIESFRAALLVYLSKTKPVLDDACEEVMRTREWLRHDRRLFWEDQIRRRTRDLEQAQQALLSAQMANLRAPSSSELLAVQRHKRALQEAQDKLKVVRRWTRELDNRVEPLVKQLEQLRTFLSHNLPKAAVHLAQVVKTLDAYTHLSTLTHSPELVSSNPPDGVLTEEPPPIHPEKMS